MSNLEEPDHQQDLDINLDALEHDLDALSDTDPNEAAKYRTVDPVIDSFKVGLLYECFVEAVRNHSTSEAACNYFHVGKPCTLIVRCRDDEEKELFFMALDDILDASPRLKFASNRPQNSKAVDFDRFEENGRRNRENGILNILFEYRRIFIFMTPDQTIPSEIADFIDAEVALQCRPEALQAAIRKFIDTDFCLEAQCGCDLMQVPVSQLISAFCEGRAPQKSCELAYAWISMQSADQKQRDVAALPACTNAPTLDDLHGLGAAGDWGRDLAMDLNDWQADRISWADVDRGILLSGAPGTGKTTFAAALARTCGVELIATSIAQWQSCGHLGDYLKAMRKTFDAARNKVPCILFIDEFDSAGNRNGSNSENASYDVKAINGLLECLDGIAGREGVVVVGATNAPERVDPALRRPGRLEKVIEIPLPDAIAREGILRFHLKNDLKASNLEPIVERSEGMAGAWLEALVRNARRSARRQRRSLQLVDLINALPHRIPMPVGTIERSAVHEAGHAIVALTLGQTITHAELAREIEAESDNVHGGYIRIERKDDERYLRTTSGTMLMIKQLLGGLAAEDIFFGERADGGWSDLREATALAARMWLSTGQKDSLTFLALTEIETVLTALQNRPDIQLHVEELLQSAMTEAKAIIENRRTDVHKIADALINHGKISGDQINQLLLPTPSQSSPLRKQMQ